MIYDATQQVGEQEYSQSQYTFNLNSFLTSFLSSMQSYCQIYGITDI
ncbi:unnamed protein product [Paramecium octaurelia]|uniref:Uncharacterized protein n=1 Tax=Paramecium octaurelia TaxID=43137 RepID=A0A8S1Y4G3_PAROT|nr:unnamed protein product [Paramecium octaurelia]